MVRTTRITSNVTIAEFPEMADALREIRKVTCLSCDWSSSDKHDIENANWYGECLGVCAGQEVLMRWDFADGSMSVTNSRSGDSVETEVGA